MGVVHDALDDVHDVKLDLGQRKRVQDLNLATGLIVIVPAALFKDYKVITYNRKSVKLLVCDLMLLNLTAECRYYFRWKNLIDEFLRISRVYVKNFKGSRIIYQSEALVCASNAE